MNIRIVSIFTAASLLAIQIPLAFAESSATDRSTHDASRGMLKQEAIGSELTNSERNMRDRNENAVLPEDQSEQKIFLDRTAAIRSEIVDNNSLSTAAHNIKIITLNNGTVILRGIVESNAEKGTIEQIAKKHSGSAEVLSHLEIDQQKL